MQKVKCSTPNVKMLNIQNITIYCLWLLTYAIKLHIYRHNTHLPREKLPLGVGLGRDGNGL